MKHPTETALRKEFKKCFGSACNFVEYRQGGTEGFTDVVLFFKRLRVDKTLFIELKKSKMHKLRRTQKEFIINGLKNNRDFFLCYWVTTRGSSYASSINIKREYCFCVDTLAYVDEELCVSNSLIGLDLKMTFYYSLMMKEKTVPTIQRYL